jgi:hypothetical protein
MTSAVSQPGTWQRRHGMNQEFPLPPEWTAIAQATGILLAHFGCEVDDAELLLVRSAREAGLGVVRMAEDLVGVHTRHEALGVVATVAWGPAAER